MSIDARQESVGVTSLFHQLPALDRDFECNRLIGMVAIAKPGVFSARAGSVPTIASCCAKVAAG